MSKFFFNWHFSASANIVVNFSVSNGKKPKISKTLADITVIPICLTPNWSVIATNAGHLFIEYRPVFL